MSTASSASQPSITDIKFDRVTILAALATLAFIIFSYKVIDWSASVIPNSFVDPLKQSLILVAAGFFQLSKNFFLPREQRKLVSSETWSHNIFTSMFVFAFTITGFLNIIGLLAAFSSGAAYAALVNAGVQGNENVIIGTILQSFSAFTTLPILFIVSLVFGWINHKKQFDNRLRLFGLSIAFLVLAGLVDFILVLQDPRNLQLVNMTPPQMAFGKLVILPILFFIAFVLGFALRSIYRFIAVRLGT